MANTSLTIGEHWESFIKAEIASGRYSTTSEVIREGLRLLEERKYKLHALRAHLGEGAAQAARGEFADPSLDSLLRDVKSRNNETPL